MELEQIVLEHTEEQQTGRQGERTTTTADSISSTAIVDLATNDGQQGCARGAQQCRESRAGRAVQHRLLQQQVEVQEARQMDVMVGRSTARTNSSRRTRQTEVDFERRGCQDVARVIRVMIVRSSAAGTGRTS